MPLPRNQLDASPLLISDSDRCKAPYILGLPILAANLAIQDIEKGRGVFFLDSHGDAIDNVLNHCSRSSSLARRCLILDPTEDKHYFRINPLQCADIDNPHALNDTFTKAKRLSDKLWKSTFEEKPWLQLILHNALYTLIEKRCTLYELPLFFWSKSVRAYSCNDIKHNFAVRNYWLNTFASQSRQTQEEQIDAAGTQTAILYADTDVHDIFTEQKPTIDFHKILSESKVVLVRLSSALSYEAKKNNRHHTYKRITSSRSKAVDSESVLYFYR